MVDINLVKKLREETLVSLSKCKEALEETNGDIEKAKELLRRKGIMEASKKLSRETKAGVIGCYIHNNQRIGVLVKLSCETDFVAKNELFLELAHNLAMHIAAMKPEYLSEEQIPEEVKRNLRESYLEEFKDVKKPKEIIEQIVNGKLKKRWQEICLLSQPYIKDPSLTIEELLKTYIAKIGENIAIQDFVRLEI